MTDELDEKRTNTVSTFKNALDMLAQNLGELARQRRFQTDAEVDPSDEPDETVVAWAESSGVRVRWPGSYRRQQGESITDTYNWQESPCYDYGAYVERVPRCVLVPDDVDQLRACLSLLRDQSWPFKVRAGNHSAGGQALIDGRGVLLDIRGLAGELDTSELDESGHVTVSASTLWSELCWQLYERKRRPVVLVDHGGVSIGGSLAVGGMGDTSLTRGLQIEHVERLRIMTLDGEIHDVGPGDELFDYTLAGRGQLGVLLDVTLPTIARPWQVVYRLLSWPSMEAWAEDMKRISAEARFEYVHSWLNTDPRDGPEHTIMAEVGHFSEDIAFDDRLLEGLAAQVRFNIQRDDLIEARLTHPPIDRGQRVHAPALEVILPIDAALEQWTWIEDRLQRHSLIDRMNRLRLSVFPAGDRRRLPLAPWPGERPDDAPDRPATDGPIRSPLMLMFILRPYVKKHKLGVTVRAFEEIVARTLEAGGRIYPCGVSPSLEQLETELGADVLERWRALKTQYDPEGLLNPGLLVEEPAPSPDEQPDPSGSWP